MSLLDDLDGRLIAEVIEGRFGLAFSGVRRDILASRLEARLRVLHLHDFREYYHYLRVHPNRETEFDELTRRLTNNETYFFRESKHSVGEPRKHYRAAGRAAPRRRRLMLPLEGIAECLARLGR